MFDISNNTIKEKNFLDPYKKDKAIFNKTYSRLFNRFLLFFLGLVICILFLPWTQNITSYGKITTLELSQRPQTIQSPIPGKIEEWYVNEGDLVEKGDTILRLSEIKTDYFDEKLLSRTSEQIEVKNQSVEAYEGKVSTINNQIQALEGEGVLKLNQAKNKLDQINLQIQSAKSKLESAQLNFEIAQTQLNRVVQLNNEGLKSTKHVEEKRLKLQSEEAKLVFHRNLIEEYNNKKQIAELEIPKIKVTLADKIAKLKGETFTTKSKALQAKTEVLKLKSKFSNYEKRSELMFIKAEQKGYINKALKSGLGTNIKAGTPLVGIMPVNYNLAVETFIEPIDLPLIKKGEKVRVQFEGWPAIVFSGWENVSYGTYGARIVAIENFTSPNGKFRVLLSPDQSEHNWPEGIRVGSGVKSIALLQDVPIWYELWRQVNGFPPNYAQSKPNKIKS